MKSKQNKSPCIRLINKYAEEYALLQCQKKDLEDENKDLKSNLKISKDIIQGFFKKDQKERSRIFLHKTKEEIAFLSDKAERYMVENAHLKVKICYYEQIINISIDKYHQSTDSLYNKIFILENSLMKKEAIICKLKLKLSSLMENKILDSANSNEIYIVEPNTCLMMMHQDFYTYKHAYENAMKKISEQMKVISDLETKQIINTKANIRKPYESKSSLNYISTNYSSENDNNYNPDIQEEMNEIIKTMQIPIEDVNDSVDTVLFDKLKLSFDYASKVIYDKCLIIKSLMKKIEKLKGVNRLLQKENKDLNEEMISLKNKMINQNENNACTINNSNQFIREMKEELIIKDRQSAIKYLEDLEKSTIRLSDSFGDELKRSKVYNAFNESRYENEDLTIGNNHQHYKDLCIKENNNDDNKDGKSVNETVIYTKENNDIIESFISNGEMANMFDLK